MSDHAQAAARPAPSGSADIAGLEPLVSIRQRWPVVLIALISLAMVAGVGRELLRFGLPGIDKAAPDNPLFYILFLCAYLNNPVGDFAIFRGLWRIPLLGGLAALLKKRIANDVVVGYTGDLYFYLWARQNAPMVAAPFGAVKDVAILSAIAGNGLSLVMLAIALGLGGELMTEDEYQIAAGSFAIIAAISLPFLIFSNRVFSLPADRLWWVFGIHALRIVIGFVFVAAAWEVAMPGVPIGMWIFLAAARLLTSRIPLASNSDLLFATFAIMLIGEGEALSQLIAFSAACTLLLHAALTVLFGLRSLSRLKM